MSQILCPVAKEAAHFPSKYALVFDDREVTYYEFDRLIQATQIRLRKKNLTPFAPFPFIAERSLESIVLFFALLREGLVAFPQSPRLPALAFEEWKPVHPSHFFSSHHHYSLPPLRARKEITATFGLRQSSRGPNVAVISLRALIQQTLPLIHLFTSGSSGSPKIATLSVNNFLFSAEGAREALRLDASNRWLLSLPLFHVGGISVLFRTFLVGGTCVLSSLPLTQALKRHAITHVSLVPTQLYSLLQEERLPLSSSLEVVLVGGAPIPVSLWDEGIEWGLPLMTSWGMTETASLVTCNGRLLPHREVRLECDGEICVRGPVLFQGYLGTPLGSDEWFATKDIGEWKGEQLIIKGRKDKLFISGGENIHPEEIECALCSLKGVIEAVVIPRQDAKWGSRPVAYIRQLEGTRWTLEEIHDQLKDRLERFKLPVALYDLSWSRVKGDAS